MEFLLFARIQLDCIYIHTKTQILKGTDTMLQYSSIVLYIIKCTQLTKYKAFLLRREHYSCITIFNKNKLL